jgi:transposase-like protein
MARIPRKSDGRRIFTAEFKREQIGRVLRGELTLADLGRKLGIARSLLQRWKRNAPRGPGLAGASRGYETPVIKLRPDQYIRELQLLVGKQTVELEILRAELDALQKGRRSQGASRR